MSNFLLKEISGIDIKKELEFIGFDKSYIDKAADKFQYKNIKIFALSVAQANILKQTALIFGADCAVNRDVITGKAENSDVILCGSLSQLKKIAAKLKSQPFKLAILGDEILKFIERKQRTTKIAGILNITPDSFSDGGMYFEPKKVQEHFLSLIQDGADIIDAGAESTRPGSLPVDDKEQIRRLKYLFDFVQKENIKFPISVDTRSSVVADFALNNGAEIINDVSGFDYDEKMPEVISKFKAGVIIQHSIGDAGNNISYDNVVEDVFLKLKNKIDTARGKGINYIIADPGIGFGKTKEENFIILDRIEEFFGLGCPVMVGLSRKRFLGVNDGNNELKDALSLAFSYPLIYSGVDYLRVHNVKLFKTLLNTIPSRAI